MMNVTIYAINPSWWMRRSAMTRHRDSEVKRNARISALFPIGYVFEEVFSFSFEACGAEAEGMVLSIGVTVAGTGEPLIESGGLPKDYAPWARSNGGPVCVELSLRSGFWRSVRSVAKRVR